MRILVDRDLCEANRRCSEVAPEVFEVDDRDELHVRVERPGPGLLPAVQRALRVCPRQALTLVEVDEPAES